MKKIIEIENINKYFGEGENRVHVLKNISFEIKKGEFIAIIGQSGSGKSTLMNILGCLDRVTDGSYKIDGREISRFSKDELSELRQQKFGFIFQRYNLISTLTALENVALPAIYAGLSEKERNSRAEELMNILGCLDRVTDGSYKIDGREISRFSKDELSELRQQKFGFIFQRYNLISTLTALENVALPAIYAGLSEKERNSRAEELLVKLGLGDKIKNKPNQLSGGQQQRVSIAGATTESINR